MTKVLTQADLPPLSEIPDALKATLAEILRREGTRFEDDPDDPGGATKCGISLAFATRRSA
jgi:lysozyme family protein